MSFQHFKLQSVLSQPPGDALNQPGLSVSPSSLSQALGHNSTVQSPIQNYHLQHLQSGTKKGPYGSGDADDGYTLVFQTMEAFQAWRLKEEEEKMIEFVKGDTHGSKAVPPRFKDHTKLVCARHSRSGRKKYVKKYPDRVRKVPSRKLEGQGCPASISYKTYFDSDMVRACYLAEHSHEIGPANYPFTKKGRKAQAEQRGKSRARTRQPADDDSDDSDRPSTSHPLDTQPIAGPSNAPDAHSTPTLPTSIPQHPSFQAAISMIAPLPQAVQPPMQLELSQERWDRMGVLFQSIRENARTFEYPSPSVVALESVLIRLYLESPMAGSLGPPMPPPHEMMEMNGIPSTMNGGSVGS